MDIERIKEKVHGKYGPSEEELGSARNLYKEISEFIESEYNLETHFAGSASRETCMAGDKDVDIFVLFSEKVSKDDLEEKGLEVGKKVFERFNSDPTVEYAEHPYTKGKIKNHEVEIVPCYDVEREQIKSSVDRTPHHTKWVKENLTKEQREDVIVLKRFLKAADLYGSSLKVQGFSGYLCEILISHYGDFETLIEDVADWKDEKTLDPENHHGGSIGSDLEEKFADEPLKVIDPVDSERNVASVLSTENYTRFVYLCMRFRERPGIDFFEVEEIDVSEFDIDQELEKRNHFVVIDFEPPKEVDDIVYPQMRKAMNSILREIEDHNFRVFESGFFVGNRARFYFEVEPHLPQIKYIKGPKIHHGKEHVKEFRSKYDNVFIEKNRLVAKSEREYTDIKELMKDKLDDAEDIGVPERIARRLSAFSFIEPLNGDTEWLKHLAEELHLEGEQRFLT